MLFSHLLMMCLGVVFIVFIVLGVLKPSGNLGLYFSPNLENVLSIFLQMFLFALIAVVFHLALQ
jgi:hypothetical protein